MSAVLNNLIIDCCKIPLMEIKLQEKKHGKIPPLVINEVTVTKKAFTPMEKYEKLKSINPAMELLRKTFDLDV